MSALKVLVAGRNGQVARSLAEAAESRPDIDLVALGRPGLDITDRISIARAVGEYAPDILINAAAYTAVDLAETEKDEAHRINEEGPKSLAEVTAQAGIPLIHISTDYVFSGEGDRPYVEDDSVKPLGVYGASKLAGEKAVAAANPKHLIFRTAWVYGAFGKNFLKTMLRLAGERDHLGVVADQKGAPTSSHDIAEALLTAAEKVAGGQEAWGTYHLTARGETSWADFAAAIFTESEKRGGPHAAVGRIGTKDFPTPAKRPAYSVLSSQKLVDTFGIRLPDWRDPVPNIVARVLNEKAFS